MLCSIRGGGHSCIIIRLRGAGYGTGGGAGMTTRRAGPRGGYGRHSSMKTSPKRNKDQKYNTDVSQKYTLGFAGSGRILYSMTDRGGTGGLATVTVSVLAGFWIGFGGGR